MFLIDIQFTKSAEDVSQFRDAHINYLKPLYKKGQLLFGGRKSDGNGGLIISKQTSILDVQRLIENDPFIQHQLAKATITEFDPVMRTEALEGIV